MRNKIIAGNWKMYLGSPSEALKLAKGLLDKQGEFRGVDVVLCPPATVLTSVCDVTKNSDIAVGAQNIYPKENGAYTGEISAVFLKDMGVKYVILGHSERRQYFNESDSFVNEKVKFVLSTELIPIMCVGETEQERERNETRAVVTRMVSGGMANLTSEQAKKVVIAYEPVWAIGTGKTAKSEDAQEVHSLIRELLAQMFNKDVADNLRIQYGGSVKPENAAELLSMPDIDGALVGGASLKLDSFSAIVMAGKA